MSVILMKNKDALVPEDVLAKVLQDCPSSFGVARAINGTLERKAISSKTIPTEAFMSMQTALKGENLLFHFGKYPAGINLEDLQPFTLLAKDKDPLVLAFMEGDFTPFHDPKSSHNNAFLAFTKRLRPLAEKAFKTNDQDLDKFLAEMRDDLTKQMIETMSVSRNHVTLFAANGQVMTWSKPMPSVHKWGWYSPLSEAKPAEEPKEAEPKLDDFFEDKPTAPKEASRKLVDDEPEDTEDKPVETPKTSVPVTGKTKLVDDTSDEQTKDTPKEVDYEIKEVSIPGHLKSRNQRKKWLRENNLDDPGEIPEGWQKPGFKMRVKIKKSKSGETLKTFENLDQHVDKDKLKTSAAPVVTVVAEDGITTTTTEENGVKVTSIKSTPKAKLVDDTEETPPAPPAEPEMPKDIPFIPAEQQERLFNDLAEGRLRKIIDASNQKIIAPEKMQELEAKWPTFWEKTATHFEECAHWPPEAFVYLSEKYPESLAVLSMNLRTIAFINANEIEKMRKASPKSTPQQAKKLVA